VPAWLARFAIGEAGVAFMTTIRGSSNAKAKRELGWEPHWRSWREGFGGVTDRDATVSQV
jgi:nucleoside-diphosphate-sugar epimerase